MFGGDWFDEIFRCIISCVYISSNRSFNLMKYFRWTKTANSMIGHFSACGLWPTFFYVAKTQSPLNGRNKIMRLTNKLHRFGSNWVLELATKTLHPIEQKPWQPPLFNVTFCRHFLPPNPESGIFLLRFFPASSTSSWPWKRNRFYAAGVGRKKNSYEKKFLFLEIAFWLS